MDTVINQLVAGMRRLIHRWPDSFAIRMAWRIFNRLVSVLGIRVTAVTKWGGRFRCNPRDIIQNSLIYFGVWEPTITRYLTTLRLDGHAVLDIGASIGYHTILCAKLVGPAGKVFAVEPMPRILALLRENIQLNDLNNVVIIDRCVTTTPGPSEMYYGPDYNLGKSSLLRERAGDEKVTVEGVRFLDLLPPDQFKKIRLVKIDVEGGEIPILEMIINNYDCFDREVSLLVELSAPEPEPGDSLQLIFQSFLALGYFIYRINNSYEVTHYTGGQTTTAATVELLNRHPGGELDILVTRLSPQQLDQMLG
jgi:FkbM family methyltransferase